jgi:hypothetical protein
MLNGPFTPDLATPISKFAALTKDNGWKDEVSAALIGSCTNSSYEDMVGLSIGRFRFGAVMQRIPDPCCGRRDPGTKSWFENTGSSSKLFNDGCDAILLP